MTQSGRAPFASSGRISGSGLASAKISGRAAMRFTITGLEASGPIAPSPSTAVPFVMTATRLPRAVRLRASAGSAATASQAAATPGVYASARSRWLIRPLVGTIAILPGTGVR